MVYNTNNNKIEFFRPFLKTKKDGIYIYRKSVCINGQAGRQIGFM